MYYSGTNWLIASVLLLSDLQAMELPSGVYKATEDRETTLNTKVSY
jgi:hypothetical protein